MQPSVLMNRFIINLRSLGTTNSSQGSSAQHWSRFSTPNFYIPDSFLGNIGEDLQDGHEPADNDHDDDHETNAMSLNIQGSSDAEFETTFTTSGSPIPGSADAQVSIHKVLKSKLCNRTALRLDWFPEWFSGPQNTL